MIVPRHADQRPVAGVRALPPARQVLAADTGTPQMQDIASAIKEGAEAFLRRQNRTIAVIGVRRRRAHLRPALVEVPREPAGTLHATDDYS